MIWHFLEISITKLILKLLFWIQLEVMVELNIIYGWDKRGIWVSNIIWVNRRICNFDSQEQIVSSGIRRSHIIWKTKEKDKETVEIPLYFLIWVRFPVNFYGLIIWKSFTIFKTGDKINFSFEFNYLKIYQLKILFSIQKYYWLEKNKYKLRILRFSF